MKRVKQMAMRGLAACLFLGMLAGCGASQPTEEDKGSAAAGSAVQEQSQPEEKLFDAGPTVRVDGRKMKTESVRLGKTIMISAEEFADMMQAEYQYDVDRQTATITWNDRKAVLTVDEPKVELNGKTVRVKAPIIVDDTVYIPATKVAKELAADARVHKDVLYITPYAGDWDVPEGYSVPVLMYHAVSDNLWGGAELFVSPSSMEEQLLYLKEHGYTTITFEDLYRIDEIEKPVMLTFDDGYDDNYEYLYPLLRKYDSKATIFMISGRIGSKETHKMTAKQLKELSRSDLVSIQSHTFTHESLGTLSRRDQEAQIKQAANALLECTGKYPFVLCYPHGSYNEDTLDIEKKYHHFGIKINGGLYRTGDNPLLVNRYYVSRYTDLSTFASYLQ